MNTSNAKLVGFSRKVYEEWYPKTVLVQSCDNSFEGELNLETRELDIPVYHDISIHLTTIKERQVKPADPEFLKASTKRVTIDKGRYSHWADTNIDKLIDSLQQENSEVRRRLIKKWAIAAEKELAEYCAKLPTAQTIDAISLLGGDGILDKDNIITFFDLLKARVTKNDMEPSDFTLFASYKLPGVIRDAKIQLGSNLDANEAFRTGYVGECDGINIREIQVSSITTRNATSAVIEAEWGIWKTKDGIQYVIPYKNTISYEISPQEVLLGATGYQVLEYYDFFNLYPSRLYKVKIRYAGTSNPPTIS